MPAIVDFEDGALMIFVNDNEFQITLEEDPGVLIADLSSKANKVLLGYQEGEPIYIVGKSKLVNEDGEAFNTGDNKLRDNIITVLSEKLQQYGGGAAEVTFDPADNNNLIIIDEYSEWQITVKNPKQVVAKLKAGGKRVLLGDMEGFDVYMVGDSSLENSGDTADTEDPDLREKIIAALSGL